MLAHVLSAVEDIPELRALVLRVPLSELVTMTEETFLGTRLLLISSGATMAASNLYSSRVSSRVVVCNLLRDA